MRRAARTTVTVLLALTAALILGTGAAATGLTVTADTATPGPQRTSVVLAGTYSCGLASGRPGPGRDRPDRPADPHGRHGDGDRLP